MSSELPGAFPSEDVIVKNTEGSSLQQPTTTATTTTGAGQSTHTEPLTDPAAASPTTDAPGFTEDVKSFAEGAMTTAAAIGLAAKDAAIAAKDAAMPVVTDAAVTARDAAIPTANVASEKAVNAAGYAKDSAVDLADTARANAPSVLPGAGNTTTSHNAHLGTLDETTTGIPTEVRDSIVKSGRGPEAAGDWQAVQDKHRMESELLHSVHKAEAGAGDSSRNQNQGTRELGAIPGSRNGAQRPVLYTQDTGSYQTPGTAVVLGTDTERAFPLGAKHDEAQHTSSTSVPDFAETPRVTTGLKTSQAGETSNATGRGEYTHEAGSRSHAEDVGSGYGSTERRNLTSSHGGPALADVPLREIHAPTSGMQIDGGVPTSQHEAVDEAPVRESTNSTGSAAYKTLSSGTPSGMRQ